MKQETYNHLKEYFHLLNVDYENGIVLNRKPQYLKDGYVKIKLKQKMISLHVVISFIKFGKKAINLSINHEDGDKTNNKPDNLTLMTMSENIKHAYATKLKKPNVFPGEKHGKSKLTDNDVKAIKKLLETDILIKDIAARYNVHYTVISKIKSGERWKHVI